MEYQYSEEIDQDLYDLQGLGIGVPLRMHKDFVKEIEGTLRLQRDWNKYISQVDGYNGGLGHRFHFMSATIPECLPDRLEVISYANEFAFLYDGNRSITIRNSLGKILTSPQMRWKSLTSRSIRKKTRGF